jgi:drug/metabolite transporter (DMT)-like permease
VQGGVISAPDQALRLRSDLILLLVTLLWGSAFAVMRVAAGHDTIFLLNGARFLLGGLLLLPWTRMRGAIHAGNRIYVFGAGFALFSAVAFQQAGLATTTAANGGFITSLYVVIVPFLLWVFWRERPSLWVVVAVLLAVAGGFLLSTAGRMTIQPGDLLILCGSFFWALHVVIVGKAQGAIAPLPFAFGQFLVCGVLSLVTGLLFERPAPADLLFVLPAILYTAVFSIALGFTLQVIAQKNTPTSDAALILSLESVTAALFGWLFLGEKLIPIQLAGCALILLAVLLVQLKFTFKKAKSDES